MLRTVEFAVQAHAGQERRFSKEPFVCHPIRVAATIHDWGYPPYMVAASLLHDVVEDTEVTVVDIEKRSGYLVARLVGELTNYGDSWEERKRNAIRHMREEMSEDALIIKCADRIDNLRSTIVEVDITGEWPFRKASKDMHRWYAEEAAKVALERLGEESRVTKDLIETVELFIAHFSESERGEKK